MTTTVKERLTKLETRLDNLEKKIDGSAVWIRSIGISIIVYIVSEVMKGIN